MSVLAPILDSAASMPSRPLFEKVFVFDAGISYPAAQGAAGSAALC